MTLNIQPELFLFARSNNSAVANADIVSTAVYIARVWLNMIAIFHCYLVDWLELK